MSPTKSSTVTKSNMNQYVEVSSETPLSQSTYKEVMSSGIRDTSLIQLVILKLNILLKKKLQRTHLDFCH